jgi:hypothetical protein
VLGNWHATCGTGEKLEITSNAYLLLPIAQRQQATGTIGSQLLRMGRIAKLNS